MERDEETGLALHGARYYSCWLGRWTACDPIGLGDGVNRYGYAGSRPVGSMDRAGREEKLGASAVADRKLGNTPYPNDPEFGGTGAFKFTTSDPGGGGARTRLERAVAARPEGADELAFREALQSAPGLYNLDREGNSSDAHVYVAESGEVTVWSDTTVSAAALERQGIDPAVAREVAGVAEEWNTLMLKYVSDGMSPAAADARIKSDWTDEGRSRYEGYSTLAGGGGAHVPSLRSNLAPTPRTHRTGATGRGPSQGRSESSPLRRERGSPGVLDEVVALNNELTVKRAEALALRRAAKEAKQVADAAAEKHIKSQVAAASEPPGLLSAVRGAEVILRQRLAARAQATANAAAGKAQAAVEEASKSQGKLNRLLREHGP